MHKMLKKMSEKLRTKFAATTPSCPLVKLGRLHDSFLEVCQTLQRKEQKKRKGKGKKKYLKIDFQKFCFLCMPEPK